MTRGQKKKKTASDSQTPSLNTPNPNFPSTHRPITRSYNRDPNILVSEPNVMGDSVQEQLSKLFDIVLAEQQANKERAAQMAQMHSKMDSISTELEAAKQARQSSSIESQAKSRNDK